MGLVVFARVATILFVASSPAHVQKKEKKKATTKKKKKIGRKKERRG